LALTLTFFYMPYCSLTQTAVDQILADFATNISLRPTDGRIDLNNGANAAPSAAGLVNKAIIQAHGWTVNTN